MIKCCCSAALHGSNSICICFDFRKVLCFGSEIKPHQDKVDKGHHYRLNVILKEAQAGGEFICSKPIFETPRIKFFRPDECEHSVTKVTKGARYVLSVGWVRD
eukprot:gnl/MRDRNA2_/MRDRNA2_73745_c0_seq1.p1 gnl/MRDRNA2_/MRDRNA2_73745_c0~~gnl/MRDRNA2_/MRDRNA2_73745_c0_seq1.p1  ORF type:complete len:103 (-),score=7.46 gnl/MRDRNA2_/MRDRNA2_73745_c0_seq1:61-369(-)